MNRPVLTLIVISAPDYIQFYPTLRCNAACDFCFNQNVPATDDMTLSEFERMVARLRDLGVRSLDVMGGEPTLHRDLSGMIANARAQGLAVNVSSNGSDPEKLGNIMQRYPGATVGISINERRTLASLKEFIVRRKPVVKSLFNADPDASLIAEILEAGPKRYYLLYRDALDQSQLEHTLPFDSFVNAIRKRFSGHNVGTVYCSGFLPDIDSYPVLAEVRCPAGTTKLGVLADGSVYPCNLFFGRTEFRLGNILSDPFEKIWRHPALSFFRQFDGNSCTRRDCELHAVCHGGCPAHALAYSGGLAGPDPRCVQGGEVGVRYKW